MTIGTYEIVVEGKGESTHQPTFVYYTAPDGTRVELKGIAAVITESRVNAVKKLTLEIVAPFTIKEDRG